MFGKKPGDAERTGQGRRGPDASSVLQEACDRNVPICVVKPMQGGVVPMARGRLLRLNEDSIDIDELHVPGLEMEFNIGDELEAYFSMGRVLYQCRTRIVRTHERKRLNRRMIIPGMTIERPTAVDHGDRRRLFRVALGGMAERVGVDLWRLRTTNLLSMEIEEDATPGAPLHPNESGPHAPGNADAGEEEGRMNGGLPSFAFNVEGLDLADIDVDSVREHDYEGWLTNGTEAGFGVRLEFVKPERFSIFEPVLLRLRVPGSAEPVRFLCEIRSKRAVGDDGTRLGVVVIGEDDKIAFRQKTAALRDLFTQIQRDQLRRQRKRAG